MNLQKTFFLFFVLCIFALTGLAQKKALSKIDTEDLKRHLTFLASDELQGRKLGTEVDGLGMAAEYLAENAQKNGLKPGAENYFQKVDLVSTRHDNSSFVEIVGTKEKVVYTTNKLINLAGSAGAITIEKGEIVLLGFGSDKIDQTNLENKIVVVAQGNPESFKKGDSFRWNNRLERKKIEELSAQKPRAIVLVTNPQDKENKTYAQISNWFSRGRIQLKTSDETTSEIPTLIVLPEFADGFLGRKGKYLKYLEAVVNNKIPVACLDAGKNIKLKIAVEEKSLDAKNVVGIVEGSDPDLKDEYLVFMAHYDHLGVGKDGEVYNGADDNGSGTVALLELGEAFAALPVKPKRSIVFLWVSCEEIGLLGSKYYVENPIFEIEKTVTCVNLDMVGRVFEPRDSVWNRSPKKVQDWDGLFTLSNDVWPQLAEINQLKCKELGLVPDESLPSYFLRSSDHYHFHRKGVPTLNYASGYHADYHKTGDELEKINFEKIKRVSDLCFLLGYEIANLDNIDFKKPLIEKE